MRYRFDPDYCVAPGGTLAEWMDAREASTEDAARALEIYPGDVRGLIDGDIELTAELAVRLEGWTGISARIWINMETTFRDGIKAGKTRC